MKLISILLGGVYWSISFDRLEKFLRPDNYKKFQIFILFLFFICCLGVLLPLPIKANDSPFEIVGNVSVTEVIDGDSLRSGKLRIRLFGIDAPEINQKCVNSRGKEWACGKEAKRFLKNLIKNFSVLSCKLIDSDRYGRLVMRCLAGPTDISRALVRAGLALAYRRYAQDYISDEELAKSRRSGFWNGQFVKPWKWRKNNSFAR